MTFLKRSNYLHICDPRTTSKMPWNIEITEIPEKYKSAKDKLAEFDDDKRSDHKEEVEHLELLKTFYGVLNYKLPGDELVLFKKMYGSATRKKVCHDVHGHLYNGLGIYNYDDLMIKSNQTCNGEDACETRFAVSSKKGYASDIMIAEYLSEIVSPLYRDKISIFEATYMTLIMDHFKSKDKKRRPSGHKQLKKFMNHDYVFIPHESKNHWTLYVIDTQTFKIACYNSLGERKKKTYPGDTQIDAIKAYFDILADNYYKKAFNDNNESLMSKINKVKAGLKNLQGIGVICPKQTNGQDCGFFVIKFASVLAAELCIGSHPKILPDILTSDDEFENMDKFRNKCIYELVQSQQDTIQTAFKLEYPMINNIKLTFTDESDEKEAFFYAQIYIMYKFGVDYRHLLKYINNENGKNIHNSNKSRIDDSFWTKKIDDYLTPLVEEHVSSNESDEEVSVSDSDEDYISIEREKTDGKLTKESMEIVEQLYKLYKSLAQEDDVINMDEFVNKIILLKKHPEFGKNYAWITLTG